MINLRQALSRVAYLRGESVAAALHRSERWNAAVELIRAADAIKVCGGLQLAKPGLPVHDRWERAKAEWLRLNPTACTCGEQDTHLSRHRPSCARVARAQP